MGERLFRGMYHTMTSDYLSSLADYTQPEQLIDAARSVEIDRQTVVIALTRFYQKTAIAFARSLKEKHLGRRLEIKQDEEWLAYIVEYITTKTGAKITNIIKSHYSDIERIARLAVQEGIDNGYGMDKIARLIRKRQGEIDLWKALRIARTEVVSASSYGTMLGAEGLPGSKEKIWISTFDSRSRPEHMEMDGVRVGLGEMFMVAGEAMEYPGDPNASPENIINCRCGYEVIIT